MRSPGCPSSRQIRRFRDEALEKSLLDFGLHVGLFDVEHQLGEVAAAFREGITSFKVFMTYAKLRWMTDDYWLTALLDVVGRERGLVAVHAENGLATDYLEDKFLREGARRRRPSRACVPTCWKPRRSTVRSRWRR